MLAVFLPLLALVGPVVENAEAAQVFPAEVQCFNGEDLEGWTTILNGDAPDDAEPGDYVAVYDGLIHMYRDVPDQGRVPFGVIKTAESYDYFQFSFEYRWVGRRFAPRAEALRDAGMLYHCYGPDKVWPNSVECQVQEGDTGDLVLLQSAALTFMHPRPGQAPEGQGEPGLLPELGGVAALKNPGRKWGLYIGRFPEADHLEGWTSVDVLVHGSAYARHTVNGQIITRLYQMQRPDGTPLGSGPIALQLEGAEIQYRNLKMIKLDKPLRPDRYHLAFGPEAEGTTATREVSLTNDSQSEIVLHPRIVGTDAAHFSVGADLPESVAPGQSVTLVLQCRFHAEQRQGALVAGLQIGDEATGCFLTLRAPADP